MALLEVTDLHARVAEKEILKGISLTVNAGEIHAIMGPNGSGKSTLAGVLSGRDAYEVTGGDVQFEGKDLLELEPEERAEIAPRKWRPYRCDQCAQTSLASNHSGGGSGKAARWP